MDNFTLLKTPTSNTSSEKNLRLRHNLNVINGIRIVRDKFDLPEDLFAEDELVVYNPSWTYGEDKVNKKSERDNEKQIFVPNYVTFAQKCLKFIAYFRENVDCFLNQRSSIRKVVINYFLENDTISVIEPVIKNAGHKQGKLVGRCKVPKNEKCFYVWKDFNIGEIVKIYGVNYHIVDCDNFTRHFLSTQGLDVPNRKPIPDESISEVEKTNMNSNLVQSKNNHFHEQYDVTLTFIGTWNLEKYKINYYLGDNTISVHKIPKSKNDDDPMYKTLIRRMKIFKEKEDQCHSYLERLGSNQHSTDELKYDTMKDVEYYSPEDFRINGAITFFGRKFELIDCNDFTRNFYLTKLNIQQPPSMKLEVVSTNLAVTKTSNQNKIHDESFSKRAYNGVTKRDAVLKRSLKLDTKFRYLMEMDAVHSEDTDRKFILEYSLGDGTLAISEIENQNSGRIGGGFLSLALVAKPDSKGEKPLYYTEQDLFIGAKINVFNHHFTIVGTELAVWNYMQAHPDDFNDQLRENIKNYFSKELDSSVKIDN